ncbi:MAG: ABC transporter permease [Lachnospiraceae bacterium]|nr:ABC transporter permease [Lachnospiraceae bacterium]
MSFMIRFIVAAVVAGTPLLFGTLGEIMNERVGHLNLGVEGMMSLGAVAGFMVGYRTDNFALALIAAFAAGALGALIYAIVTVTFMANHTVAGLTLTIFGIGLTNVIGFHYLGMSESGTLKLPEHITQQMRAVHITGLSDVPVIGPLLFQYNPFVYVGIVIAVLLALFYNFTKAGLNVRAIGENPQAADAAGVHVLAWKYVNIVIGGGICGIGGAFTIMITNGGVWISDCVGGLGWIAVALVIFATWKPVNAIWGSFVFGAMRILKYYVNKEIIHIPDAFYDMLPFLVTAVILVLVSARQVRDKAQPAACGTNYFREDR